MEIKRGTYNDLCIKVNRLKGLSHEIEASQEQSWACCSEERKSASFFVCCATTQTYVFKSAIALFAL
jgi:hypothetical protein